MSRERPRISKVAASHFVNVTEVFNVIKKIEFQRERKLLLRLSKTLSKARYEILLLNSSGNWLPISTRVMKTILKKYSQGFLNLHYGASFVDLSQETKTMKPLTPYDFY